MYYMVTLGSKKRPQIKCPWGFAVFLSLEVQVNLFRLSERQLTLEAVERIVRFVARRPV